MSPALPFTGERFTPECAGGIWYEHWHRYVLAAPLARGRDVLDAACGEGYGSAFLASGARSVTGLDVNPAAIRHARARYGRDNLRYLEASVTRLPLEDDSFDLVVSFETIEHLAEQEAMLAEFRRVLRPSGLLLLSAPNRPVYSDGQNFRNEFHVREHDRAELEALLRPLFPCQRWQGQRLLFHSAAWPLAHESGPVAFSSMGDDLQPAPDAPAPMYFLVAAASDPAALPAFDTTSLFSDPALSVLRQHESLMAWQWDARDQLHTLATQRDEAQRLLTEAQLAESSSAAYREALQEQVNQLQARLAVLEPASRQYDEALNHANAKLLQSLSEREDLATQLAYRNSWLGWLRWPLSRLRRLFGS